MFRLKLKQLYLLNKFMDVDESSKMIQYLGTLLTYSNAHERDTESRVSYVNSICVPLNSVTPRSDESVDWDVGGLEEDGDSVSRDRVYKSNGLSSHTYLSHNNLALLTC